MRLKEQRLYKLLIILSIFCFSNPSYSESPAAPEVIKHKATQSIASGKRLTVKAKLSGKNGIKTARVYFKSQAGGKYNFVVMNEVGPNIYEAELPATAGGTKGIDYKIVAQDAMGAVHKTSKYSVPVESVAAGADAASVANQGFIDVFSEYPQDLTSTTGFSDAIRYSYDATKISGTGGGLLGGIAAGNATTTVANTAGLSNLGWAGVGVGAVAAGGAVAAAASDSGGTDPVDDEALSTALGGGCFTGIINEVYLNNVYTGEGLRGVDANHWFRFVNGKITETAWIDNVSETGCIYYSTLDALNQEHPEYHALESACFTQSQASDLFGGGGDIRYRQVSNSSPCSLVPLPGSSSESSSSSEL